ASDASIDCTYANYGGASVVSTSTLCNAAGPNNVGTESSKGDGKWGQADLSGNVFEWLLDFYAQPYAQVSCIDCANFVPSTSNTRSLRGSMFAGNDTAVIAARRDYQG